MKIVTQNKIPVSSTDVQFPDTWRRDHPNQKTKLQRIQLGLIQFPLCWVHENKIRTCWENAMQIHARHHKHTAPQNMVVGHSIQPTLKIKAATDDR